MSNEPREIHKFHKDLIKVLGLEGRRIKKLVLTIEAYGPTTVELTEWIAEPNGELSKIVGKFKLVDYDAADKN